MRNKSWLANTCTIELYPEKQNKKSPLHLAKIHEQAFAYKDLAFWNSKGSCTHKVEVEIAIFISFYFEFWERYET